MGFIRSLGYFGLRVPDVAAWGEVARAVLDLSEVPATDGARWRMDDRLWRIGIEPGPTGIDYVGWEVADAQALTALTSRISDSGVAVKVDAALAAERGVDELIRITDPGGYEIEIFHSAALAEQPVMSRRGTTFVTGALGLGHVVLSYPDALGARDFYRDLLGFRLSDSLRTTSFMHVNPRHHSLATGQAPAGEEPSLRHFMLEVDDLDMVGRAWDAAREHGVLARHLGKHTNDHSTSFYVQMPSSCMVEFGTGGRIVDDATWVTSRYTAASQWGHQYL
jgi:3,4-dihydroxy-9,10-secoandrosta-1,3,5(10)-triene-9,17-dione 4,5-dioxygenase